MGWPLVLYNLLLWLGLVLLSPVWGLYLLVTPKARAGFSQKLGRYPAAFMEKLAATGQHRPRVWIHCVSVGEFNAVRPLIDALADEVDWVITTTTRTGQALAQRTYPDRPITYFPYDFRGLVHRALTTLRPDAVVLTETELWPNFLQQVRSTAQVPLLVINGRISPGSFNGYRKIRPLMAGMLSQVSQLYMQSTGDAQRIQALGADPARVTVAGNIKFDLTPRQDPIQLAILKHLLSFDADDTVLTLASTHSGEDGPLVDTFQILKKDFPELKLVLAPRHPERAGEIRSLLTARGLRFALRSQLSELHPNSEPIVVLDTIGELQQVFALSRVAVIGGSFVETGGHNPLEALVQKIPALFGPHMFNFPDISRLVVQYEAGYQVASAEEIIPRLTELLTQPELYANVVENGQRLLAAHRGAKALLVAALRQHLNLPVPREEVAS
jgi:3-deoxy-D-manno-octulosonic-acid transferase